MNCSYNNVYGVKLFCSIFVPNELKVETTLLGGVGSVRK